MESETAQRRARPGALAAAIFLWIPVVVAAYYVVHKPWGTNPSIESLWPVADLLLGSSLVYLAAGVGSWVLASRLSRLDPLERAAAKAAVGLGLLSLVVLGVGLIGWLSAPVLWVLLVTGLVFFGRAGIRWLNELATLWTGWQEWSVVRWVAAGLVAGLTTISLAKALAPPTAWDSLVYHLELPKTYLAAGHIGFDAGNLFVGFPQLAEMIFTWAMALRGGETAAVAGWWAGVLGLVATVGFARRVLGVTVGWLPAAFLLTGASLWQGLSWAYVDHWVLLFGAVSFLGLDYYAGEGDDMGLILGGIGAGCALATKYTGGGVAVGGGLFLIYFHLFQRSSEERGSGTERTAPVHQRPRLLAQALSSSILRRLGRDLLVVGGLTMVLALPWFLRNALQMGNPLYPFFFPGKALDSLRQLYHAQRPPGRDLLDALLLPWQAIVQGTEGGPRFNVSLGPLALALIPGLFLGLPSPARTRRSLQRLVVLAAVVWLLWAAGAHWVWPLIQSRLYFGFLPALAVLAVGGYLSLRSLQFGPLKAGWVLSRFLLFVFALTAISAWFYLGEVSPTRVLTRRMSRQEYLEEQLGWYARVMRELNRLPQGSKVRFLWEPRAYYCQVECVPDVILDQWWHLGRTVGPPPAIAAEWAEQGVTHVLIYDLGVELEKSAQPLLTESDWRALEEFRMEELSLVRRFGNGVYSLYELP